MAVTVVDQLLSNFLNQSKANAATQAIVFIMMKTENQQITMCRFLADNDNATDEQIMEEARKIAEK